MARAAAKALGAADLLYRRLPAYQHALDTARRVLANGLDTAGGAVGVAWSGGKDSTVALHLARDAGWRGPVAFADSGAEYPETHAFIDHVEQAWGLDLCRLFPDQRILDLHALTGWWDWGPKDTRGLDFARILIREPMAFFAEQTGVRGQVIGLRAAESLGRSALFRVRGSVHAVQGQGGVVHIHPLASWSVQDVWAYIAAHALPYNAVYDRLTALGVPREQQRVSSWAGTTGHTMGRFAVLKAGWPDLYQRFADAFPRIKEAT